MKTEMYIQSNPVDLDVDISSLITFSIAELQDFSTRSTSWSKTITLPGTDKNNLIFGHIFDIGQANEYDPTLANFGYNFNASKSADVLLFQDNIQTFKGGLRLLQINISKGRKEYEVGLTGDLSQLNVSLSSGKLEDLDFSEYDDTYSSTNIIASWDNPGGSGVYYPLIDYGTYSVNKHDWDIGTFRPALYAKEYIDKMFAAAGFTYNCDLFNTTRFKNCIIPHSQKKLTKPGSLLGNAVLSTPYQVLLRALGDPAPPDTQTAQIIYDTFSGTDFTNSPLIDEFTYTGVPPISIDVSLTVSGSYSSNGGIAFSIYRNRSGVLTILASHNYPFSTVGGFTVPYNFTFGALSIPVITGDVLYTVAQMTAVYDAVYDQFLNIDSASFTINGIGSTVINVNPGDEVNVNATIPINVRQIDFFLSICHLWNLYVYEDRFDNRLIHIAPYVDFYSVDTANSVDWTYKIDRDGVIKIKPMSELNSKIYNFNYTEDSDYFNDLYNKRYGQQYGSYIYDSQFEFTSQENALRVCFAPTVLVGYDGEDKVYSTIYKRSGDDSAPVEDNTDSIIRILQAKKITGVSSWDMIDNSTGFPIVLSSHTEYPYAGHLNDPDAPSDDLNFGALQQLFFVLATGNLSATQFNLYWSSYMAEITDKDSKLMTGEFYLNPKDIFNLDFSKYVNVDGVLFRLNKIIDYNMSNPATCNVELLKVIFTSYTV